MGCTLQTLLEWRRIFKKFSEEVERYSSTHSLIHYQVKQQTGNKKASDFRILVVKQKGKILSPLNTTLVDVVLRSILPSSTKRLFATEVSDAIEEHLQTKEDDVWIGWMVKQ